MSRWNRPMRTYRSSAQDLRCASCGGRFRTRGDVREEPQMVDGQLYHVPCAPKAGAS
jgi:hypothetical protein